jgi:ribosomal 50S subunit-recycling heat shock protein
MAKDLADAGRIEVDGRQAKAALEIRPGQQVRVNLGRKTVTYEILQVPHGNVSKEARDTVIRRISEDIDPDW